MFGDTKPTSDMPDLKVLQAKISRLALAKDFLVRGAHQGGISKRKRMIDQTHALLVARQCQVLGLSHSMAYYQPTPVSAADLELMRRMGLEALYRKPRTSHPHPARTLYPYLLRDLMIRRPNHVWAGDITYFPMQRGFVYLFAVLD